MQLHKIYITYLRLPLNTINWIPRTELAETERFITVPQKGYKYCQLFSITHVQFIAAFDTRVMHKEVGQLCLDWFWNCEWSRYKI